jgi:hypothetical protein
MINLKNINKATSATMVKIVAVITMATVLFPQWFDTIPFAVSEVTKEAIHWVFKGVDMIVALLAIFMGVNKPEEK